MSRPQRWDAPFGPDMTDAAVDRLLARPEFATIRAGRFPSHAPLREILRHDTRLVRFKAGDLVVREGDYGSSAFVILSGTLRVVLTPGLPRELLGRRPARRRGWWQSLAQLWRSRRIPEVRDTPRAAPVTRASDGDTTMLRRVFLQDVPAILDAHKTAVLTEGALFGELAALGRVPRTATMFAETDAELLEIRWQGLREIRRFDEGWRRTIDEHYRANALRAHLRATPLLANLDGPAIEQLTEHTLFETYGTFDWHVSYKRLHEEPAAAAAHEPLIARQGEHPDGLLLIRAGFARVTAKLGNGQRTLIYLGAGDHYGIDELYAAWQTGQPAALETSLTAVGYVDVLRVPTHILEKNVFPQIPPPPRRFAAAAARPLAADGLLEWLVDERLINGTRAMLIDLDRCTRCDDCVRACGATHGGNPRFLRAGATRDHWMVTHACMHCADPVCMIGCPTGAIHRAEHGGVVVINDDTCVGCGTCANSCPYDNIVMSVIRDARGAVLLDAADREPILKATKCDLCEGQLAGPACVRACPHDALQRVDFRDLAAFGKPS
ncbi:MAG: cyclic nucleotide-binding domain-containing protein [Verrucomicrobia bacterium]|nr:cyclic nucleotide-binding domain-containing protein [Verrucomicrobiota bacterium]